MMRSIKAAVICALLCVAASSAQTVVTSRRAAPAGPSAGEIKFFLGFEANDTTTPYTMGSGDCSDGDTTGDLNQAFTITATTPLVGTYSGFYDTAQDNISFSATSIFNSSVGSIGFVFYGVTDDQGDSWFTVAGTGSFEGWYYDPAGAQVESGYQYWSSETDTDVTCSTALQENTETTVQFTWDRAADRREIYWNGTLCWFSDVDEATWTWPTGTVLFRIGGTSSEGGTQTMRLDNIIVLDNDDTNIHTETTWFTDTNKPTGACDG